jgi:diaminopimelate epimerase
MNIQFYKYQATGNDFIILDNRDKNLALTNEQIAHLCHRRYGIGADGLMLLEISANHDFKMMYYNADGYESTMCGNGGRCLVKFAYDLGIIKDSAYFIASDGSHQAFIKDNLVELKMIDVNKITYINQGYWLNTGSPHFVKKVENIDHYPVFEEGKKLRYSEIFAASNGTNVNFMEVVSKGQIKVRTYERGVENETLSCGTGVTACALALLFEHATSGDVKIETPGGSLQVSANFLGNESFHNIWLKGPAEFVFKGEIRLKN